jgi:SNF2 family DNA or RNA helicase
MSNLEDEKDGLNSSIFPVLDAESNSDEDGETHEIDGPALPNTLETVLSIFPLAESRKILGSKRSREALVENSSVAISGNQLREVLFPSEDDLLEDSFSRVDIDSETLVKRRRTESKAGNIFRRITTLPNPNLSESKKKLSLSTSLNPSFRSKIISMGLSKSKEQKQKELLAKQEEEKKILSQKANSSLPEIQSVKLIQKLYSYMIPNEFNVRMVTPYTLFDYQTAAVKWMIDLEENKYKSSHYDPNQNGGLLAMVMGLGKTPTAATLVARTLNQQRMERSCTLYVCPKNLLGTVLFQFEKFFGDQLKVIIYHRDFLRSSYNTFDATEIRKYDVVIANYASIVARISSAKIPISKTKKSEKTPKDVVDPPKIDRAAESFCNFPWFRIILDESHEIREKNTQRFRAMMTLKSPRRFCVTGTPIYNRVSDIFHQLEFTGLRLAKGIKYTKSNLKNLDLMKMIRFVEYKDAQSVKLPPKEVRKVYFQLSPEEKFLHAYYMKSARAIFEKIQTESGRDKSRRTMEAHVSMIRVMQVCSAPYLITPASKQVSPDTEDKDTSEDMMVVPPAAVFPTDNDIDKWIQVRESTAGIYSSKMNQFVKTMKELRENADEKNPLKVVIFANYTSTLRLAISAMTKSDPTYESKSIFVYGGITSAHKREELYTQFRLQPKIEALFMTLKLGAIGLNLSEANKVIFLEPWFSFSALQQGESRVHRIGQMRPVDIYYFLAADSAEERVYRTAQSKKELAQDIANQQNSKLDLNEMKYILFEEMDLS